MKLSEKRRGEIYDAVSDRIVDARIEIARMLQGHPQGDKIDHLLFKCGCDAGSAAIRAAEGAKE